MSNSLQQESSDWDDTALQTSWNEAYAEYQKYHSLAAQGRKVSSPQSSSSTSQKQQQQRPQPEKPKIQHLTNDRTEETAHIPLNFVLNHDEETSGSGGTQQPPPIAGKFPATPGAFGRQAATSSSSSAAAVPVGGGWSGSAAGLSMPGELFSGCGVQSDQQIHMKNLMMSWYYAGYYTGLLEGQQKAWAEAAGGGSGEVQAEAGGFETEMDVGQEQGAGRG